MTIEELKTEIATWHRSVYPEPDEKVWPLCLAKFVEEVNEMRCGDPLDKSSLETADTIICAFALVDRMPKGDGRIGVVSGMAHAVAREAWFHAFLGSPSGYCPRYLEARWNEVKQRTPEVQRARDKERGIEV